MESKTYIINMLTYLEHKSSKTKADYKWIKYYKAKLKGGK